MSESQSELGLGPAVLAIIKTRGERGAFTDEITQRLLALHDKIRLERLATRPGPTGPDSDRVRAIVGVFRVRGFLKEDSPAKITEKGEAWMKTRLEACYKEEKSLEGFWSLLKT